MATPGTFALLAVDVLRACPALWRPQNDHRPCRTGLKTVGAGIALDLLNLIDTRIDRSRHDGVNIDGVAATHEVRRVAESAKQLFEFFFRDARKETGIGNLVAIQVQNGQHGAVAD